MGLLFKRKSRATRRAEARALKAKAKLEAKFAAKNEAKRIKATAASQGKAIKDQLKAQKDGDLAAVKVAQTQLRTKREGRCSRPAGCAGPSACLDCWRRWPYPLPIGRRWPPGAQSTNGARSALACPLPPWDNSLARADVFRPAFRGPRKRCISWLRRSPGTPRTPISWPR